VLRQGGSECSPGKTFLPIAIGDIKQSYNILGNLGMYMAEKSNFKPGEVELLDLGNRAEGTANEQQS